MCISDLDLAPRRIYKSPILPVRQRLYNLYEFVKEKIKKFNLFESKPLSIDAHEITNQLHSTRLFIITFTVALIVLVFYTSLSNRTVTVTIKSPTLEHYSELQEKYPQTLLCPCTEISIPYSKLIQLSPTYHQLCSSQFITDEWFQYTVYKLYLTPTELIHDDFRWRSSFGFQMLSSFCQLSSQTINDELLRFYSLLYLSSSSTITSNHTFQVEIQALIKQFQSTTKNSFLQILQLILDITQSNSLISGLNTNYYVTLLGTVDNLVTVFYPRRYNDCYCQITYKCNDSSFVVSANGDYMDEIPGFMEGCFIVYSLLQSTLECWYQQSCFQQLINYINVTTTSNFTILDPSQPSQYQPTTTVQEIVNNLMIEQWNSNVSFESYYQQCQPNECRYTYTENLDYLYTITTIMGLIGGLSTVLTILIPNLVNLIRKRKTPSINKNG
ncbi:unnamed protein product [Didymodactylos carnosus]|uniref:Uncharacterized protein n=1 Tax=Didymodactylos carnosus TaxID=1234261 RepID=A0A814M232_9BILA|nr:unnamed protein product [Didymodactylos carnosus]CAF1072034.1 unnamed protein product [Didymodactylos carnosus]CAF3664786.1 unnamed protein product [Didymodactylos carnosus]CAF3839029.1 unnamed protein product [Didymodactylos carnosus]